jgi:hypothetical protein
MLYGKVSYRMKDGTQYEKEWAARAVLVQPSDTESWKLKFYQVYLVSFMTDRSCILLINRILAQHQHTMIRAPKFVQYNSSTSKIQYIPGKSLRESCGVKSLIPDTPLWGISSCSGQTRALQMNGSRNRSVSLFSLVHIE